MKGRKNNKIVTTFLPDVQEIKDKAIQALRNSFEIEGVYFTDEEIRQMVNKVRLEAKS